MLWVFYVVISYIVVAYQIIKYFRTLKYYDVNDILIFIGIWLFSPFTIVMTIYGKLCDFWEDHNMDEFFTKKHVNKLYKGDEE